MAKTAVKEKEKGAEQDDVEVAEGNAKAKTKQPWLVIAVIALSSILVLAAAVGGTVYFMSGGTQKVSGAAGKATTEDSADAENSADADSEDKKDKPAPANYVSLDPPFVVNFEGNSSARFLQINVEVMSRKIEYAEHIKKHMPVIRNNLVLLFGSQTYDKVSTLKGKEELREKALAEVQKILEEETGDTGVEALYFTSFVMQ